MNSSDDFSRLQGLAARIEPRATWNDLAFLTSVQVAALRDLATKARQTIVGQREAAGGPRGPGFTALFTGQGGTGKTMAAEVIATELQLNLYRIDLRAAVSRYIGETEKDLARLFDAAEKSAVILLFDEADALFGKRSEVKDSHDRYANLEINYLMGQMEAARGLTILAAGREESLDDAWLRRIRLRVHFPSNEERRGT
jgi:SpoVK/Ycf46/Vps4 family AAA+-type ATPase